jgi:predicted amidophosphoribosyltransferase
MQDMTPNPAASQNVQFVIPVPYRAWCHHCERGFATLEKLVEHVHETRNVVREK